jgi:hypothetical protein
MKRRTPGERVDKLRFSGPEGSALQADLARLAGQCKRWIADHEDELIAATPTLPDALHDRAADNWFPLLCVAQVLGGHWGQKGEEAALILSGNMLSDTDSIKSQLLRDIRAIIEKRTDYDSIWSQHLSEQLVEIEERPWGEWKHGKPITPNQLARLLRPFGVVSRDIKRDGENRKGYLFCDLADAFDRYIPLPLGESTISKRYPATSRAGSGDDPLFQSATEGDGSGSKNALNPALGAEGSGVADQNPQNPRGEGNVPQTGLFEEVIDVR